MCIPVKIHQQKFPRYKHRKYANNVTSLLHCGPQSNCHYSTGQCTSCSRSSSNESSATGTTSLLPGSGEVSDGVGSCQVLCSFSFEGPVRTFDASRLVLDLATCLNFLWVSLIIFLYSGFGGLEVACWPLVPKFAGSNPAEAVGFLRAKNSSARLPSEGK